MFYVYAIESQTNGRVYIGQTNDYKMRIQLHNRGYVKSTASDLPWVLISLEEFDARSAARWREHELKKSRKKRIRWMADNRL